MEHSESQESSQSSHPNEFYDMFDSTPVLGSRTSQTLAEEFLRLLNQGDRAKNIWHFELFLTTPELEIEENFWKLNEGKEKPQKKEKENSFEFPYFGDDKEINQTEKNSRKLSDTEIFRPPKEVLPTPEKVQTSHNEEQNKLNKKGCSCKKSGCIKMYCECFRSGNTCTDCGCVGCKNQDGDEKQRTKAVKSVIEREPTAFDADFKYKGCRCSKTQCLRGYCECYMNGHTCGKYCKCKDCKNRVSSNTEKVVESKVVQNL